jgi:hypothetical protein
VINEFLISKQSLLDNAKKYNPRDAEFLFDE